MTDDLGETEHRHRRLLREARQNTVGWVLSNAVPAVPLISEASVRFSIYDGLTAKQSMHQTFELAHKALQDLNAPTVNQNEQVIQRSTDTNDTKHTNSLQRVQVVARRIGCYLQSLSQVAKETEMLRFRASQVSETEEFSSKFAEALNSFLEIDDTSRRGSLSGETMSENGSTLDQPTMIQTTDYMEKLEELFFKVNDRRLSNCSTNPTRSLEQYASKSDGEMCWYCGELHDTSQLCIGASCEQVLASTGAYTGTETPMLRASHTKVTPTTLALTAGNDTSKWSRHRTDLAESDTLRPPNILRTHANMLSNASDNATADPKDVQRPCLPIKSRQAAPPPPPRAPSTPSYNKQFAPHTSLAESYTPLSESFSSTTSQQQHGSTDLGSSASISSTNNDNMGLNLFTLNSKKETDTIIRCFGIDPSVVSIYDDFVLSLLRPEAADIVEMIQTFVNQFIDQHEYLNFSTIETDADSLFRPGEDKKIAEQFNSNETEQKETELSHLNDTNETNQMNEIDASIVEQIHSIVANRVSDHVSAGSNVTSGTFTEYSQLKLESESAKYTSSMKTVSSNSGQMTDTATNSRNDTTNVTNNYIEPTNSTASHNQQSTTIDSDNKPIQSSYEEQENGTSSVSKNTVTNSSISLHTQQVDANDVSKPTLRTHDDVQRSRTQSKSVAIYEDPTFNTIAARRRSRGRSVASGRSGFSGTDGYLTAEEGTDSEFEDAMEEYASDSSVSDKHTLYQHVTHRDSVMIRCDDTSTVPSTLEETIHFTATNSNDTTCTSKIHDPQAQLSTDLSNHASDHVSNQLSNISNSNTENATISSNTMMAKDQSSVPSSPTTVRASIVQDATHSQSDMKASMFSTTTHSTRSQPSTYSTTHSEGLKSVSPARVRRRSSVWATQPPDTLIRTFLTKCEQSMSEHPIWRDEASAAHTGEAKADTASSRAVRRWATTCEGLERFVMSILYDYVYNRNDKTNKRDIILYKELSKLQQISFSHMELPEMPACLDEAWNLACMWLQSMHCLRTPCDKITCVLNSARVVTVIMDMMLSGAATQLQSVRSIGTSRKRQTVHQHEVSDSNNTPKQKSNGGMVHSPNNMALQTTAGPAIGADDMLPAVIYTVLKSCPPNLYKDLSYIGAYRDPRQLISEQGYYFSNILLGVNYGRSKDETWIQTSLRDNGSSNNASSNNASSNNASSNNASSNNTSSNNTSNNKETVVEQEISAAEQDRFPSTTTSATATTTPTTATTTSGNGSNTNKEINGFQDNSFHAKTQELYASKEALRLMHWDQWIDSTLHLADARGQFDTSTIAQLKRGIVFCLSETYDKTIIENDPTIDTVPSDILWNSLQQLHSYISESTVEDIDPSNYSTELMQRIPIDIGFISSCEDALQTIESTSFDSESEQENDENTTTIHSSTGRTFRKELNTGIESNSRKESNTNQESDYLAALLHTPTNPSINNNIRQTSLQTTNSFGDLHKANNRIHPFNHGNLHTANKDNFFTANKDNLQAKKNDTIQRTRHTSLHASVLKKQHRQRSATERLVIHDSILNDSNGIYNNKQPTVSNSQIATKQTTRERQLSTGATNTSQGLSKTDSSEIEETTWDPAILNQEWNKIVSNYVNSLETIAQLKENCPTEQRMIVADLSQDRHQENTLYTQSCHCKFEEDEQSQVLASFETWLDDRLQFIHGSPLGKHDTDIHPIAIPTNSVNYSDDQDIQEEQLDDVNESALIELDDIQTTSLAEALRFSNVTPSKRLHLITDPSQRERTVFTCAPAQPLTLAIVDSVVTGLQYLNDSTLPNLRWDPQNLAFFLSTPNNSSDKLTTLIGIIPRQQAIDILSDISLTSIASLLIDYRRLCAALMRLISMCVEQLIDT